MVSFSELIGFATYAQGIQSRPSQGLGGAVRRSRTRQRGERRMASIKVRTEHDFLGDREVPADAYYGIQTLRGSENFPITGYRIHPALIHAMGIVKKAA